MANLQVRDIDDHLYELLRDTAKRQHRSISQEVVHILMNYFSHPPFSASELTEQFIQLGGAWEGPETADELIKQIQMNRKSSHRFRGSYGILN
ncbi:MAG TPA: antitoxin [Spirochaetes bacterium]|nr:antitoxin [Spirochaetota bacterium]